MLNLFIGKHLAHITAAGWITYRASATADQANRAMPGALQMGHGHKAKEMPYDEMRWKKAVWNMPFNGMTAAVGAVSAGSLIANESMAPIIRQMMLEVIGAARACGVKGIDESYADKMMDMTRRMPQFASSMKFDRDHHRPMELYYLYRRPLAEARSRGADMPLIAMLAAELEYIDAQSR